jgi:hypothetical protein
MAHPQLKNRAVQCLIRGQTPVGRRRSIANMSRHFTGQRRSSRRLRRAVWGSEPTNSAFLTGVRTCSASPPCSRVRGCLKDAFQGSTTAGCEPPRRRPEGWRRPRRRGLGAVPVRPEHYACVTRKPSGNGETQPHRHPGPAGHGPAAPLQGDPRVAGCGCRTPGVPT